MELGSTTFIADPIQDGVWFNVSGCLAAGMDPVDIMVTDVSASDVAGAAPESVRILGAWSSRGARSDLQVAQAEPPAGYQPVTDDTHTGGTLAGCSLSVAIAIPGDLDQPVKVRGLDVTYTTEDDTYTAHGDVNVTLCPAGTKSGSNGCRRN